MDERNNDAISLIPGLLRSNVKISDPENVSRKLRRMIQDGPNSLHVIFDFDKTLSLPGKTREPVFSTLEIFQGMEEVPDWYKTEMKEIWSNLDVKLENANLPMGEVMPAVDFTIDEFIKRLKKLPMENIPQLIERESMRTITLRDNISKTFSLLEKSSVQTTILSAGLGDAIKASLHLNGLDSTFVTILSNFLKYTDEKVDGFCDPFIHIFNKSERAKERIAYSKILEERLNIILVGDTLSDVSMADGAPPTANILTIGFLNYNVEKKISSYLKTYDIVIMEDPSMDVVNDILEGILKTR